MGKLLNIRVSAQTYNEDEVAKTWPKLVALVWPGGKPRGVVELAGALPDLVQLGELPANVTKALSGPVKEVDRVNQALASALGDWDTKKATPLTFELEDALDKAEQSIDEI